MQRRHSDNAGFTLIELLVTLGIIVVLVGILIPVVSRVRKSAQAATVQQQISSLAGAIERFHQEQGRYPGPLPDAQLESNSKGLPPPNIQNVPRADRITSSENLLLGLLGGLKWVLNGNTYDLTFDANMIGKGMVGMNPGVPKKYQPYIDVRPAWISAGKYFDDSAPEDTVPGTGGANDSQIPEFLDTFSNPMPIIYLRARVGAPGVILDDQGAWPNVAASQYYLTDLLPYTETQLISRLQPPERSIGVGKSINVRDYVNFNGSKPPSAGHFPHGLQAVDTTSTIHKNDPGKTYRHPYDAYAYILSPSSTVSAPVARAKDTYILISAGPDRVYGTDDDICSFGSLNP